MAKRASISVSVTPEQADFPTSLVRRHRRAVRRAEIECARGAIAAGADDLDQGRLVEGEVFFREWDADLDEREGSRAGRLVAVPDQ